MYIALWQVFFTFFIKKMNEIQKIFIKCIKCVKRYFMKTQIYILNLARSPHRKSHMMEQLKCCPIPYVFVEALDGKGKDLSSFSDYDSSVRVNAFGRDLASTEVATTGSHLKAIKRAYDDGVDWAVILEDDVIVLPPFNDALNVLNTVSESVEVVRLYHRETDKNFQDAVQVDDFSISRFNYKNWGGALGYALNRRAMKKYLDNAFPIVHIADKFIAGTPQFDVKVYQLSPRVVKVTEDIESDIGYDWGKHTYVGFKNNLTRLTFRIREKMYRVYYIIRHFKEYM